MTLDIRYTIPEDAGELALIQREAFLPLYEKYQDKGNPCLRGPEDVLNRLKHPQRFICFTIICDGEIIGGIVYRRKGNGVFFHALEQGEYYLQRVYIEPRMQGMKIGQRAIQLCETQLKDATKFYVDFPADIVQNKLCYESAGFHDTGRRFEVEPGLTLAFYEK
jgi:ribosomal protein S18 acetylase RimI-like enzyme